MPHLFLVVLTWTHLKVPRSTSCPLSRTLMPSLRREPKAMYSPRAQSHTRWSTIFARLFRIRLKPETLKHGIKKQTWQHNKGLFETGEDHKVPPCIVKSSTGTEEAMFPICLSSSSLMPVGGLCIVLGCPSRLKKSADRHTNTSQGRHVQTTFCREDIQVITQIKEQDSLPGHGESSQCLMWRIFSSLERL